MDWNEYQDGYNNLPYNLDQLTVEETGERLRSELLQKCILLLSELEEFEQYLMNQKKGTKVELRHFKNSVKTELSLIQKLSKSDPLAPQTVHTLRSSNLPFYCAVWDSLKRCTGIVALEKRFYWTPVSQAKSELESRHAVDLHHRRSSVLVDIVARDGSEWVKVSTMTEKRFLFDMAKAGWIAGSSSEGSDAEENDDDDEPEGLMKQAEALKKASGAVRVRYRHPQIRIVLPKIRRGSAKEVDELIEQVELLGIRVETSEDADVTFPLSSVLHQLVVDPFADFSETINVDCTILLALVSDLSHSRVEAEHWHHRAILRQIEMETESPLLPNNLWPAMNKRHLVCTSEAAKRMHEIVDLIGTTTEKQRRDCLMNVENTSHWSRGKRLEVFQELSAYQVPSEWNIPITVIDPDHVIIQQQLPRASTEVIKLLSPINQSVFLYGWVTGLTTISSNRTVAKEIEIIIEKHRAAESDAGPHIWLCPTARSLVGKEKTRRNWEKQVKLSEI